LIAKKTKQKKLFHCVEHVGCRLSVRFMVEMLKTGELLSATKSWWPMDSATWGLSGLPVGAEFCGMIC
jgi:hypothetical protein